MTPQERQQLLDQHHRSYPLCASLNTRPAVDKHGHVFHESYDIDELEAELGPDRFKQLIDFIIRTKSSLVCHGHRNWPADKWPKDHPDFHKNGTEVHCVRAYDLEEFLRG